MEIETEKRATYTESRRLNGGKGGRPKKEEINHMHNHMRNHMGNHMGDRDEDENISINNVKKERNNGTDLFEKFWQSYPKKVGKKDALKAWAKIKADDALVGRMVKTIAWQKKSEQWQKEGGRFVPNPSTWLNRGQWDDEVERNDDLDELF